jgi:putative DNA primase/helicase
MINKLVNIHTDISASLIDDSILKMIEDREPITVDRKNVRAVSAFIPAVHIYCCNEMPRSLEGDSTAYDRRITILSFTNTIPEVLTNTHRRDYEQVIWDAGPDAVLQWAKEGLLDLVSQKGNYTVPESGKKNLKEWKLESDHVAQFLEDIRCGELGTKGAQLILSKLACINASRIYFEYLEWAKTRGLKYPIGRNKFYRCLRNAGFVDKFSRDKILIFAGIGILGAAKDEMPQVIPAEQVHDIIC